MTMNELIMKAREKKCSDIHISEGMPVSFRIHGQLLDSGFSFPAAETREMILSMLSDEQREQLENPGCKNLKNQCCIPSVVMVY